LTDERLGGARARDVLWTAVARLPRGAGIIFRHHATTPAARRAILRRLHEIARRRSLLVLGTAPGDGGAGLHLSGGVRGRSRHRMAMHAIVTAPAHDAPAMRAAVRAGADLLFVSPIFPTASHPEQRPLGAARFGLLARTSPVPVIALGGVGRRDTGRLRALGASGVAAIDAWTGSGLAWHGPRV
jgi:thiamine-phosphate pyrophosphorylase